MYILVFVQIALTILEVGFIAAMAILMIDQVIFLSRTGNRSRREKAAKRKSSLTKMMRKEELRRLKEAEAHKGFFEESYVRAFAPDGASITRLVRVPTKEAMAYYKAMDDLTDAPIFDNTEEL